MHTTREILSELMSTQPLIPPRDGVRLLELAEQETKSFWQTALTCLEERSVEEVERGLDVILITSREFFERLFRFIVWSGSIVVQVAALRVAADRGMDSVADVICESLCHDLGWDNRADDRSHFACPRSTHLAEAKLLNLGRLRARESLPLIVRALKSPDRVVACAALEALALLRDKGGIDPILALLRDPRVGSEMRAQALFSLSFLANSDDELPEITIPLSGSPQVAYAYRCLMERARGSR
jgi:hypothetical protein